MRTKRLSQRRPAVTCFSILAAAILAALGAARPAAVTAENPPAAPADRAAVLDPYELATRIDQWFDASWTAEKVEPAPPADDAEFLRRAYVDLAGKIPPVPEARDFLDDPDPEKRRKLVERLLGRATYPAHFARTWRDLLLPGANNNVQIQFLVPQFEAWLRLRLASNTTYDKLASELLTASSTARQAAFNPNANAEPNPAAFFQANEFKPESLASSTSRIFLGVQLECAQCHNHPFARWSREQFWGFAAFFSGIGGGQNPAAVGGLADNMDRSGIEIPGTGNVVPPRFLDGSKLEWQSGEGKRATLARWLVTGDNPYFARAAVNRVWAHFFGRGLVDPVDDLDEANPPSHPEVFDELTRQFIYHELDLKYLIRAIAATRVYQLSSLTTDSTQDEPRHFARMPLKSMTGEQLFDSLVQATGIEEPAADRRNALVFGANSARAAFLNRFSDSGPTRTDYQASILQALTLMNGQLIGNATDASRGETLQAVLDAPFLDTAKRIEILYLATLTRRPRTDEAAKMQDYVARGGSEAEKKQALANVFWALLNTTEFTLNH